MIQYPVEPLLDFENVEYIVFCMTFSLTLLWGNFGGFSSLRLAGICLCAVSPQHFSQAVYTPTGSMQHYDSFLFPVWDHYPVA